jgi:hypothetical protein
MTVGGRKAWVTLDAAAAERENGEAQHAGGVRQRREGEIDRRTLEGITHQRDGGHRLEIGAGQHHAFRLAGRAARAGNHRHVVGWLALIGIVREALKPLFERKSALDVRVKANENAHLREVGAHFRDHSREVG